MPTYDFKIGTTLGGITSLSSLTTTVPNPKWSFTPWSVNNTMGDGTVRGDGFPVATWQWGFLTKAQRDQLRQFCSGKSAVVFIQTRENDTRTVSPGVTTDFRSFQATMIWPDKEEVFAERRIDFTLEFSFMVAQ